MTVKIIGSVLFSNFLPLKRAVDNIALGKKITFDFSQGYLMDHSILVYSDEFSTHYARSGGYCSAARLMTLDDRK